MWEYLQETLLWIHGLAKGFWLSVPTEEPTRLEAPVLSGMHMDWHRRRSCCAWWHFPRQMNFGKSMVYRLGHKGQSSSDFLHTYYSWQAFQKIYQYHKERLLMLARCFKQDEEIPVERVLLGHSTGINRWHEIWLIQRRKSPTNKSNNQNDFWERHFSLLSRHFLPSFLSKYFRSFLTWTLSSKRSLQFPRHWWSFKRASLWHRK